MASYTQSTSIGSLPPEIISLILTTAISALYESWAGTSRFYFPAIISRVSRRFRQVTLSTPSLWSYIYLIPSASEAELAHIQDRINRKSGASLLDIRLLYYNDRLNTKDVIATLSSCSTRWRSLSVSVPFHHSSGSYSKYPVWDLLRAPTPYLRFISFSAPDRVRYATLGLPHPIPLPNATRSLELIGCSPFGGELNFKFPSSLETLTTLEVDTDFHLTAVIGALEPLQHSLKSLKLGFGLSNLSDDQIRTPCILEQLRTLEVKNMPIYCMMRLLTHLKAPNLLRLSIESPAIKKSGRYTPTRKESILQGWKEVNFATLTDLDISDISDPARDLDACVELLQGLAPSVTHLEARTHGNDGKIAGLLGDHRLDHLFGQLKQVTMVGFSAMEITSAVEGRCSSLEWLQVHDNDIKLYYDNTKEEFENNIRHVEYLRSIVDLRIMGVGLSRDRFVTWEEGQAFKAQYDLERKKSTQMWSGSVHALVR